MRSRHQYASGAGHSSHHQAESSLAAGAPTLNLVYLAKYIPRIRHHSRLDVSLADPLVSHLFNYELESLVSLSSSQTEGISWWLEDIRSDNEEIRESMLISASPSSTTSVEGNATQVYDSLLLYPHTEMTTAGVIVLNQDANDNGSFLQILSNAYKGTQRSPGISANTKKKVTFLSNDGVALKSLEFSTEKDYWGLIYAVKRYIHGQDVVFSGHGAISASNAQSADATFQSGPTKTTTDTKYSMFSMLTSTSHAETVSKDDPYNLLIELKDGIVTVSDRNSRLLTFKLSDIKAMAITFDCSKPSPLLLKAKLEDETAGLSIQVLDAKHTPLLINMTGQVTKTPPPTSILLPMTIADIERGRTLTSTSEDPPLAATVSLISNIAVQSGSADTVLGENAIPYKAFFMEPESTDVSKDNPIPISRRLKIAEYVESVSTLKEIDVRRGVRIFVHSASGLPSSSSRGSIPPSAYCTIYLVGKNSEKLTLNTYESRTDIIDKTFSPVWEKEIVLEGGQHVPGLDTSGLEGVFGVMVKVRDAASGILKHHHIGQVVIPINCFIYQTEAKFTLPLEPTYRMAQDDSRYLGEINLTTELVTLESTPKSAAEGSSATQSTANAQVTITTSVNSSNVNTTAANASSTKGNDHDINSNSAGITESRNRRLSIVSPRLNSHYLAVRKPGTDGAKTASVLYTLYDTSDFANIWWPFRTITGGGEVYGHIRANHHALQMKLLPGAGGVLTYCKENDSEDQNRLTIPWNQLSTLSDISEGVCMLTLTINHCTSLPSQKARGDLHFSLVGLDILVAPCPAPILEKIIQDRLQVYLVRFKLLAFMKILKASDFGPLAIAAVRKGTVEEMLMIPINNSGSSNVNNNSNNSPHSPSSRYSNVMAAMTVAASSSLSASSTLATTNASATGVGVHSPNSTGRNRASALWSSASSSAVSSNSSSAPPESTIQPRSLSCKMLLLEAKTIFIMLEQALAESHLDEQNLSSTSESPSSNTIQANKIMFTKRVMLRYYLYLSHVLILCTCFKDSMDGPSFHLDYVHKIVDEDCSDAQILTPLRAEANPNSLTDRHEYIFDMAIQRLREFLICSGNDWGNYLEKNNPLIEYFATKAANKINPRSTSAQPGANTAASNALPGSSQLPSVSTTTKSNAPSLQLPSTLPSPMAKQCIEELLCGYNNALKLSLFTYTNSREAFYKIEGQAMKNIILKLVIDTNFRLHEQASLVLEILGMTLQPSLYLLDKNAMDDLIDWYSQCLVKETKFWLTKTIQHAYNTKKNLFDIPWDIEVVGTKIISHLPETLLFQLNIYLDLCSKQKMAVTHIKSINLSAAMSMRYKSIRQNHGKNVFDATKLEEEEEKLGVNGRSSGKSELTLQSNRMSQSQANKLALFVQMNEKILMAVSTCLLMLCEEYGRALQMKHWDQTSQASNTTSVLASIASQQRKEEIQHNLSFIVSIVNDCYRVLTTHILVFDPITTISSPAFKFELQLRLLLAFINLSEKSLKYIVRIIFADMANLLIEFDTMYMELTVIRSLTATFTFHFNELRSQLETCMYLKVVQYCMNVILKRYLLVLKEKMVKNKTLSAEEIQKLYGDVTQLSKFFISIVNAVVDGTAATNDVASVITKQMGYLTDVIDLLRLDVTSIAFTTLIREILYRYHSASASADSPLGLQSFISTSIPEYRHKIPIVVFQSFLALRADYHADVMSLVSAIYDESIQAHSLQHVSSGNNLSSSNSSSVGSGTSYNYTTSIASSAGPSSVTSNSNHNSNNNSSSNSSGGGSVNFVSIANAIANGKKFPHILLNSSTSSPVQYDGSLVVEDLYVLLFSEEEINHASWLSKDSRESTTTGSSATLLNPLGFSLASPQGIKFKPTQALKTLREKASDLNVLSSIGMGTKRKNEELALQLYRSLGLEEELMDAHPGHNSLTNGDKVVSTRDIAAVAATADEIIIASRKNSDTSLSQGESVDEFGTVNGTEYQGEGVALVDCSITVTEIHVKGLRSASFFSNANPYVAITLGPKRMKTSVKLNCSEAEWKSTTLKFKAIKSRLLNTTMYVRVYDKEVIRRKRLLGTVAVKLAGIDMRPIVSWFALEGGAIGSNGDIHLKIDYEAKI